MGLSEIQDGTHACHCKTEVIPLKRKMHILKKIKKRFGLARRSPTSCPGPNNLPPLQFHTVHGDNIRISRDGTLARRFESFCRAITFSARPVRVNERVCVKFIDVANNWNGGIRFGFTNHDPVTLESSLPKYACPDLTNRAGFWAKALHEQYCEKDNVLFYYVNSAGDVVYGINGDEKGVIFSGIDTRGSLWTLLDIYGNCTAVEFLDARIYMYQQSAGYQHRRSLPETEVDRVVVPSIQSLNLSDDTSSTLPQIRYNANGGRLIPVPFHITKGRNVRLSADRFIATRTETDFCQGYVFTARPLRIGEKVIVQILKTEHMYVGALALGLTSCNPATLQPSDLPDDSDFLLDRPEYWVVSKDIASTPQRGDEIAFCVTPSGEVTISKNEGAPVVVMHVDQSLQLWAFLDVYGSTQSVRVFRQPPINIPSLQQTCGVVSQLPTSPRRLQVALPASESINSLSSQISDSRKLSTPAAVIAPSPGGIATSSAAATSNGRMISVPSNGDMIQIQPGGTVLVVNLPPAHTEVAQPGSSHSRNSQIPAMAGTAVNAGGIAPGFSATMLSNGSSTYIEPCVVASSANSYNTLNQWKDTSGTGGDSSNSGAECTICYENQIDSVLYMCGHMCMCYECAIEQWRGVGGGQCPLCRAVIRDVIRTYTT